MAYKTTMNWYLIDSIIESIPDGHWMSYGDLCVLAGLSRKSAMAVGIQLGKRTIVSRKIHRVLRANGTLSAGWKGPIGTSDDCIAKLKEEGISFSKFGNADPTKRWLPQTDTKAVIPPTNC